MESAANNYLGIILENIDAEGAVALERWVLSKAREHQRPLYAEEVSRSISLQASEQPAYGEQVANDLGWEIVSYL